MFISPDSAEVNNLISLLSHQDLDRNQGDRSYVFQPGLIFGANFRDFRNSDKRHRQHAKTIRNCRYRNRENDG